MKSYLKFLLFLNLQLYSLMSFLHYKIFFWVNQNVKRYFETTFSHHSLILKQTFWLVFAALSILLFSESYEFLRVFEVLQLCGCEGQLSDWEVWLWWNGYIELTILKSLNFWLSDNLRAWEYDNILLLSSLD